VRVRSGVGFDVHPLVPGRPLVLGGVRVPYERGSDAHSDGDVLAHAVIDAAIGAAGLGDIGAHFPSSDPAYQCADSMDLLRRARQRIAAAGWQVTYVDATIVAEEPRLAPYVERMKEILSVCLGLDANSVNVKATTTDGIGFTGRSEGIAALAIATVESTK